MWSVSVTLSKLLQLITQFPSFSTLFLSFSFFFFLFSFSFSHLAKKVVSACHSEMTLACHVCFLQTHVKEHFVKAWPAGRCNQQVAEVVWRTNHTIQQSFLFFSFLFFSFVAWLFEKRLFLPFCSTLLHACDVFKLQPGRGEGKLACAPESVVSIHFNPLLKSVANLAYPTNSFFFFLFLSYFLSFFFHHYHPQICFPSFLPSSSSSSSSSSSYCLLSCFVFKYSKSTFL